MTTSIFKFSGVLIFFLMLLGCSSSEDDNSNSSDYYFKFSLNGEQIEYTETTFFNQSNPSSTTYLYSINGGNSNSGFTINIYNDVPLANEQQFTENIVVSSIPQSYLSYTSPNATIYDYSSWLPYSDGSVYIYDCHVTITYFGDTSISGTFFGTIALREHPTETYEITSGSFKIKRVN